MIFATESDARQMIATYYGDLSLSETVVHTDNTSGHWVMFADPYVHLAWLRLLDMNRVTDNLQRYLLIKCNCTCSVTYLQDSHIASTLIDIMPYLAITLRAPTSRALVGTRSRSRSRTVYGNTSMWHNLELRHSVFVRPTKGFYQSHRSIRTVELQPNQCIVLPQCTLMADTLLSHCMIHLIQPTCWGEYGRLHNKVDTQMPIDERANKRVLTPSMYAEVMKHIEDIMTSFDRKIFLMRNIIPIDIVNTAVQLVTKSTDNGDIQKCVSAMFCCVVDDEGVQTHLMPRAAIQHEEDDVDTDEMYVCDDTSNQAITLTTFYNRLELMARLCFCSASYLAQHQSMTGALLHQLYLPVGRTRLLQSNESVIDRPAALPIRFETYNRSDLVVTFRQTCDVELRRDTLCTMTNIMTSHFGGTTIEQHCNDLVQNVTCFIPSVPILSEDGIQFLHLTIVLFVITICPIVVIDEAVSIGIFVLTRLLCDNRTFNCCLLPEVHEYHEMCLRAFLPPRRQQNAYPSIDKESLFFRSDDRCRIKLVTVDDAPRSGNNGNHRKSNVATEEAAMHDSADGKYKAAARIFWRQNADVTAYNETVKQLYSIGLFGNKKKKNNHHLHRQQDVPIKSVVSVKTRIHYLYWISRLRRGKQKNKKTNNKIHFIRPM